MKRSKAELAKTKKPAAKRNVKVRATARKVQAIQVFAHYAKTSSPYHGVTGSVRGLLICAAFVVAGFAKLNKENLGKGAKGNAKLFKALVGDTPYNYHRRSERIVDDSLSAGGLEWFQHRIANKDARDLTAKLVAAMQKGGEVEGLKFDRKVTVA